MNTPEPPETITNIYGNAVPRERVRPELLLEDQLVRALVDAADTLRASMAEFKTNVYADVQSFMDLLAEKYRVRLGGRRGGLELTSFDGLLRVQVSVADAITLGPEIRIAKDLIDQCLTRWSAGANANLRAVVEDAFAVGEGGRVRIDRILGLRRLAIEDEQWEAAMAAIADAVRVLESKSYLRFYRRSDPEGKWVQIALDFAKV